MAPNGARSFFPANLDSVDILGRTDLDFRHWYFLDLLGFQISRFPGTRFPEIWPGPGLGQAWALGRVWSATEDWKKSAESPENSKGENHTENFSKNLVRQNSVTPKISAGS